MSDYKLVPKEPTWDMEEAGQYALEAGCYASGIYADMLAAAPQPALNVDMLVEALRQIIKTAPSRGPLWHGSEQIIEACVALRHAEIVLAALAAYRKGGDV